MNKKVLILALALVVAFASSAMAAVSFSGKFTTTVETDSFKFEDGLGLSSGATFAISASNKSETEVEGEEEDHLNWEFDAALGFETGVDLVRETDGEGDEDPVGDIEDATATTKFSLGGYKLSLYDQYFTAHVWGNGKEFTAKATPFEFISVGKKADDVRARLIVPVVDIFDLTVDFEPEDKVNIFVDGEVEGYNVGLAFARKGLGDDAENTFGVYGKGTVEGINLKADAGFKLGGDTGLAFGVGADTMVTDELKVEGSVKYLNDKWTDKPGTTLAAKATYTETEFQVVADGSFTLRPEGTDNENKLTFTGKYRLSADDGYGVLFNRNAAAGPLYHSIIAPAFGVTATIENGDFASARVDAAAPVVEDMAWVHGYGLMEKDEDDYNYTLDVVSHVLATNKLTLNPAVKYASADKKITATLGASYKIGLSDTTLSLKAEKVLVDGETDSDLLQASIEVPF